MLTKNQNMAINFFLSRALFLGGGVSNIFALCGKDAWISAILGTLLGVVIILIFYYYTINIKGNLNNYLKKKNFLNYILKFSFFTLYSLIIFISILSLSTLVSSYYLSHTPSIVICAPIVLLLIYITMKGLKCVGRVAQILFPICLFITITKIFLLMETADFSYFLPIFTTSCKNIFLATIIFTTLSVAPSLLLIEEQIPLKNKIINYLIGTLAGVFVIINITSVLGDTLVRIFSFPEYAILRKIEFFRFFENVENIIAFIWLGDLFIIMAMTLNRLNNLLNNKRLLSFSYLIILSLIITLYIENHFNIVMYIYNTFIYLFIFLLIFIIILLFIKNIKRKKE